jgi:hypothetical protein
MEPSPASEDNISSASQKFAAFHGTQRFITVFTRASHPTPPSALVHTLSQISPVHAFPPTLRSILTLSSYLSLGLPTGLFPAGVPTKPPYAFLFSYLHCTCPVHLIRLGNPVIWLGVPIMKLLTVRFSPVFCYFLALWPKCRPEHAILEHPQLLFFPQCD